jgi:hypothetical protein
MIIQGFRRFRAYSSGAIRVPRCPCGHSSRVDTPGVGTPGVDTPGVDTPVVDTPVVDTPVVDTPGEGPTARAWESRRRNI